MWRRRVVSDGVPGPWGLNAPPARRLLATAFLLRSLARCRLLSLGTPVLPVTNAAKEVGASPFRLSPFACRFLPPLSHVSSPRSFFGPHLSHRDPSPLHSSLWSLARYSIDTRRALNCILSLARYPPTNLETLSALPVVAVSLALRLAPPRPQQSATAAGCELATANPNHSRRSPADIVPSTAHSISFTTSLQSNSAEQSTTSWALSALYLPDTIPSYRRDRRLHV